MGGKVQWVGKFGGWESLWVGQFGGWEKFGGKNSVGKFLWEKLGG